MNNCSLNKEEFKGGGGGGGGGKGGGKGGGGGNVVSGFGRGGGDTGGNNLTFTRTPYTIFFIISLIGLLIGILFLIFNN